jgi:hypothetical protein
MAHPYWSVRLVVDVKDYGLFTGDNWPIVFARGVREARLGGGDRDADEPPTITLSLEAPDAQQARLLGQIRLDELRKLAGVRGGEAPVVWVARLSSDSTGSLRFLEQASELLDEERFEMAVLAAQIHLEVHVKALVDMIAEVAPSPLLDALRSGQRIWSPHDDRLRPMLDAVLGITIADFPRWAEFRTHMSRRNDVAHRGQAIDAESAKATIDVVSDLWLWLNNAATATAGPV